MSDHPLQPQELAARGLGSVKPGPATKGDPIMAITGRPAASGEMYTPDEDVVQTNAEGLQIQVASKGVPMPMRDAIKYGLVPNPQARAGTGPSETKEGPRRPAASE